MAKGKKTGGRDFKPGQSGNPKGGPGLPKDLRDARKINQRELERVINLYLYMDRASLNEAIKDPKTPMVEIIAASIIAQAAQKGDQQRLEFILARMIGKVTERIEVEAKPFIYESHDGTDKVTMGAKAGEDDDQAV